MAQWIMLIAIVILGGLAITGTLFPAIESLTDIIVTVMRGDDPFTDFDAKFISVGE